MTVPENAVFIANDWMEKPAGNNFRISPEMVVKRHRRKEVVLFSPEKIPHTPLPPGTGPIRKNNTMNPAKMTAEEKRNCCNCFVERPFGKPTIVVEKNRSETSPDKNSSVTNPLVEKYNIEMKSVDKSIKNSMSEYMHTYSEHRLAKTNLHLMLHRMLLYVAGNLFSTGVVPLPIFNNFCVVMDKYFNFNLTSECYRESIPLFVYNHVDYKKFIRKKYGDIITHNNISKYYDVITEIISELLRCESEIEKKRNVDGSLLPHHVLATAGILVKILIKMDIVYEKLINTVNHYVDGVDSSKSRMLVNEFKHCLRYIRADMAGIRIIVASYMILRHNYVPQIGEFIDQNMKSVFDTDSAIVKMIFDTVHNGYPSFGGCMYDLEWLINNTTDGREVSIRDLHDKKMVATSFHGNVLDEIGWEYKDKIKNGTRFDRLFKRYEVNRIRKYLRNRDLIREMFRLDKEFFCEMSPKELLKCIDNVCEMNRLEPNGEEYRFMHKLVDVQSCLINMPVLFTSYMMERFILTFDFITYIYKRDVVATEIEYLIHGIEKERVEKLKRRM